VGRHRRGRLPDTTGNVFCGGAGVLYIVSPKGKKLGRIVHGYENTANVGFGGDDWKTVFSALARASDPSR
jgi:sugar lactone lactonase YvrE